MIRSKAEAEKEAAQTDYEYQQLSIERVREQGTSSAQSSQSINPFPDRATTLLPDRHEQPVLQNLFDRIAQSSQTSETISGPKVDKAKRGKRGRKRKQ